MEPGVQCDARPAIAQDTTRDSRGSVGAKGLSINAIGQVKGRTPGEAGRDVGDDFRGLASHQPGMPIADALEPHAQAVTDASRSDHAEPYGALRPQVRHIEHHARSCEPAQPEAGQPEKQGWALHEEVVGRADAGRADGRGRQHEREVVCQASREVRILRRVDERPNHPHTVPLFAPQQAAVSLQDLACRIARHRRQHRDGVPVACEFARQSRQPPLWGPDLGWVVLRKDREVHRLPQLPRRWVARRCSASRQPFCRRLKGPSRWDRAARA